MLAIFQCTGTPSHWWQEEFDSFPTREELSKKCSACGSDAIVAIGNESSRAFVAFKAAVEKESTPLAHG